MKLLFDATELSYLYEYSGHRAGVFQVALNLFKEFKTAGINIAFCCDYRRYFFLKEVLQKESIFKDIRLIEEYSLINLLWANILYSTRKSPLLIRHLLIILARIYDKYFYVINEQNLSQLKDFDTYFSPFTPPSKEIQYANLKRFRMIHDVIPLINKKKKNSSKDWHNKIYNTINEKDFYITNSEYTKQDVLKYFPFIKENHIKATLLAANRSFYPTEEKIINENYIFSLCTLGKRKNLKFAIENFFTFIKKHNIEDLKLVLGGSVWKKYEKELSNIINKYDSSKIILTGYINDEDLKKYYSNALCFIYPSLYEGFGLPVLEAMQCGCPVITSNRTSLPEVIDNAGIQINPESNKELINAYERMYFDKDFRKKCINKGLERAKLFSWEKCAKEIIGFIKSTL